MVAFGAEALGGLVVLVNNAGVSGPTAPVDEMNPDEWEEVVQINLNGTFYVTHFAIPHLKKSAAGVIINMSSVAGRFGYPDRSRYLSQGDELRKQIADRERRERAVKGPSLISESDLSNHRLIDSVFIANIGTGSGSMVLAGITVHKQVIGYQSNSGKSTGWRVQFDWTGSDGMKRHSETIPPEADNRRNDPDRNWGLHE